ncbi:hypothetical protein BKA65DRAFT_558694 [Rhexocercosporidium sp. MPI-PUGE-AT-0058]|nr:hypothetical protein BKA65DRAFT_558694 [Rhexocercosporidium sp. MPI-PUGE-AT-0058]
MAGDTRYHRLPEDNRPSLDSAGEDERLLDPREDTHDDDPTSPKKKQLKYSFHPTLLFRFVSFVLYLAAAIVFLVSRRQASILGAIFAFIAMGRQTWVLLHHLLTRFIRVRVRIELRQSGSSITTKPKKKVPAWLLLGFVQVAIDVLLVSLALGTTLPIPHHYMWHGYFGPVLGGKVVAFIAIVLHLISVADMGQPSRLTVAGKLTFEKEDDDNEGDNPPHLPIYRDVEATGAGEVRVQSRKTGADSPPGII